MGMGFRAHLCAATGQRGQATVWMAEPGSKRSDRIGETALRRAGDYRCCQRSTYCTPRIDAGRGMAPAGGCNRSCTEQWSRRLAGLAGRGRSNLSSDRPGWGSDVPDRAPRTPAELEVRRVYEPSRLAAAYLSAAYARVVPCRRRPARAAVASELASVSRVVDDRHQPVDGAAPRAS
jgi:hypothetical protein